MANKDRSEAYKEYDRQRKRVGNQSKAEVDRVSRRMRSPQWLFKSKHKSIIRRCIKNKTDCTRDELGYTADEFRRHIEGLFLDGMTWDNYGDWHVDHIVPIIWMFENGIHDPKEVSSLSNIQPMWAKDNMAKSTTMP